MVKLKIHCVFAMHTSAYFLIVNLATCLPHPCVKKKNDNEMLHSYRLLTQLPSAHRRLLTCVMFLLHRISENSDENCMTSFNLAVCIGQSLLWQHGDAASTEKEKDKNTHADARENVPRFIEFLIEHTLEIFECPSVDGVVASEISDANIECLPTSHVTESSTDSDSMHSMLAIHERPCHLSEFMIIVFVPVSIQAILKYLIVSHHNFTNG